MAFNFAKVNKERLFSFDNSHFPWNDPKQLYKSLETLYQENGENEVYVIRGLYISTKSEFDPETPVVMYDNGYANLPVHQLSEVKDMISEKSAVKDINDGKAGFVIEKYHQKRFNKDCYVARWGIYDDLAAEKIED